MTDLEYKRELRSLVRAWTHSTKDYGLKIAKLTRKYRAERVQRAGGGKVDPRDNLGPRS